MTTDAIWQSFANAYAAAGEADALHAALYSAMNTDGLKNFWVDENWTGDSWWGDGEWLITYFISSSTIREKTARGAVRGTLSVAISFYRAEDRSGEGWTGARRAKVYVGLAPKAKAWSMDTLLLNGDGQSDVARPITEYRWAREGEPGAWFFCLALDALNSRESLHRELLAPLSALLAGVGDDAAFDGCSAVLRVKAD